MKREKQALKVKKVIEAFITQTPWASFCADRFHGKFRKDDIARAIKMLQNEGLVGSSYNSAPIATYCGHPRNGDWNYTMYIINKHNIKRS